MGCYSSKASRKYKVQSHSPLPDGEYAFSGDSASPDAVPIEVMAICKDPARPVPEQPPAIIKVTGGISNYTGPRSKLDPKDFRFVGLSGAVAVKKPGSINGQAFTIDNCQDCDLYVLDRCGQVTIDGCKNTRIFIGPTEGSIFIRDSTNCTCAFICRQLRTRTLTNSKISLLCRTQPIVESSSGLQFGCFNLAYTALTDQLAAAKLSVLHNFWSHIYDFTPGAEANWSFLPKTSTTAALLSPIPEQVADYLSTATSLADNPLLETWGERPAPASAAYLFAIFPAAQEADALCFAQAISGDKGVLLRSNQAAVSGALAGQMAEAAGWPKASASGLTQGQAIGFEVACGSPAFAAEFVQLIGMYKGLTTDNGNVGAMFRHLGFDGRGCGH